MTWRAERRGQQVFIWSSSSDPEGHFLPIAEARALGQELLRGAKGASGVGMWDLELEQRFPLVDVGHNKGLVSRLWLAQQRASDLRRFAEMLDALAYYNQRPAATLETACDDVKALAAELRA